MNRLRRKVKKLNILGGRSRSKSVDSCFRRQFHFEDDNFVTSGTEILL